MKRLILFSIMISLTICGWSSNEHLLRRLDNIIANDSYYRHIKQVRTSYLKQQIALKRSPEELIDTYEDLYNEYFTYNYDSTLVYIQKGMDLACKTGNVHCINKFRMYKANTLIKTGFFSEAKDIIDSIDIRKIEPEMRFEYYHTLASLYGLWSFYCRETYFEKKYHDIYVYYIKKAIPFIDKNDPDYDYYVGDYYTVTGNEKKSLYYYFHYIKTHKENLHTYAMACYSIAYYYRIHNNTEKEEEFFIRSAISDRLAINKETSSLRHLATLLLKNSDANINRADNYIFTALQDANFFGTKLRTIETAQELPEIMTIYKKVAEERNKSQKLVVILVSLIAVLASGSTVLIVLQNRKLHRHQKELARDNVELAKLNGKLGLLNTQLKYTGNRRESIAKLFIDLCAKYIDRYSKFQMLVKRKIKANQIQELLSTISSYRLNEEDASLFLNRFDEAFLELYPTFVDELNTLLRDDSKFVVKVQNTLSPEMRVYALIRLGVTDSSEIAALLYYSPQTIYNYRSQVKARAINKETLDTDVQNLCLVLPDSRK